MKVFYCSTCFEYYYIHPQEPATVCRCIVLFRCVPVYWCSLAGVGWYPNAGWSTSAQIHNPGITLKTAGHQWYWSYGYSDFTKFEFDSYTVQEEDQQINTFRLLDTDNRIVLPINSPIRIIVTAADVLHSWTVPRLGVKTDATPGWLNQVKILNQSTWLTIWTMFWDLRSKSQIYANRNRKSINKPIY